MIAVIVVGLVAMLAWTLFSARLSRWQVTGPVAMVLCGIALGFIMTDSIVTELDTELAERIVELILAVLLFIDATEVRGGYLGGQRGIVARLLGIALPVSLVLAVLVGLPLLGVSSIAIIVAIALVLIPVDFAPAAGFLRDRMVPSRLRSALSVESGYADAIRAPIFAFALVVVESPEKPHSLLELVEHALPDIGFAIVVGAGVGALTGLLGRIALHRGWVRSEGLRLAAVLIPLVTYACAVALHGNGFVAAFIAGITYRIMRLRGRGGGSHDGVEARETELRKELRAVEDIGALASLLMWFVFGTVVAIVFLLPLEWLWLLYGLLALTLLRSLPVQLSMLGSGLPFRERAALGFMGPRGTSTIVFGLLAFNAIETDDAIVVLYVMVVTVLGSVILHGLLGPFISRRILGRSAKAARGVPGP